MKEFVMTNNVPMIQKLITVLVSYFSPGVLLDCIERMKYSLMSTIGRGVKCDASQITSGISVGLYNTITADWLIDWSMYGGFARVNQSINQTLVYFMLSDRLEK